MAVRNLTYTTTVAVAGTTTVCVIPTGENGVQRLGMTVINGAGGALDAFSINVRCGKSTVWNTIAGPTTATDYSTAVAPFIRVVGAPITLAASANAFLLMDVHGIAEVQITASANTTEAPLTIEATLG